MTALARIALPVDHDEPFLYHDVQRPGFAAVLRKLPNGRMEQRSAKLADLPAFLDTYYGHPDVWISQCEFRKPNRKVVNLWHMPLAFVDLDVYKLPHLSSLSPESHADRLIAWCSDEGIPPPSVVVFSGRGLQVKWLFREPVPTRALPRWQAIQRRLNNLLEDFGADTNAMDASRVLRLVDTCSSRSGETVRIIHTTTTPTLGGEVLATGVVGYDFEVLADTLLPHGRAELEAQRTQADARRAQDAQEKAAREARKANFTAVTGGASPSASKGRRLIPSQLAWDRLEDLRTLARLRGFEGGLPPGQRDLFVFLAACFLADARVAPDVFPEVIELAQEFAPTWSDAEVMSCVSAVVARAQAAARGETVKFRGLQVSPKYRWRNATLVERLCVSPEEEQQLNTIISETERKRRDAERHEEARRKSGAVPRAEWLANVARQKEHARGLQTEGWTLRAIARELGVSPATVVNYCRP